MRIQLSNLYVKENKDEENIALFKQLDDEDLEPQVHWNLAVSYQNLDQSAKAKSEFLLAYPEFKDNSAFLKQMIRFFNTEPNAKEIVKELLEKYLKLEPEDTEMQEMYDNLNFK